MLNHCLLCLHIYVFIYFFEGGWGRGTSVLTILPIFVFLRFAVIASGCASCPRLVCNREGCGAEFCYHCKQAWHPNQTCDSARQQRAHSLHTHSNHSPSYTQEQGPSKCFGRPARCIISTQLLSTQSQFNIHRFG